MGELKEFKPLVANDRDGVIVLPPPEVKRVGAKMAEVVGIEAVRSYQKGEFCREYFERIREYARIRFGEREIGVRAILGANEKGEKVWIEASGGEVEVATIEEIINNGGEYRGLTTRITRMGREDTEDTDMSVKYLEFNLESALRAENPGEVGVAVLVYDLNMVVPNDGGYEVKFKSEEDKKKALLGVYVLDIRQFLGEELN